MQDMIWLTWFFWNFLFAFVFISNILQKFIIEKVVVYLTVDFCRYWAHRIGHWGFFYKTFPFSHFHHHNQMFLQPLVTLISPLGLINIYQLNQPTIYQLNIHLSHHQYIIIKLLLLLIWFCWFWISPSRFLGHLCPPRVLLCSRPSNSVYIIYRWLNNCEFWMIFVLAFRCIWSGYLIAFTTFCQHLGFYHLSFISVICFSS